MCSTQCAELIVPIVHRTELIVPVVRTSISAARRALLLSCTELIVPVVHSRKNTGLAGAKRVSKNETGLADLGEKEFR